MIDDIDGSDTQVSSQKTASSTPRKPVPSELLSPTSQRQPSTRSTRRSSSSVTPRTLRRGRSTSSGGLTSSFQSGSLSFSPYSRLGLCSLLYARSPFRSIVPYYSPSPGHAYAVSDHSTELTLLLRTAGRPGAALFSRYVLIYSPSPSPTLRSFLHSQWTGSTQFERDLRRHCKKRCVSFLFSPRLQ